MSIAEQQQSPLRLDERPVLIMVSPTGARRMRSEHPALPVTTDQIVETAVACHAAGAGAIHVHLRNDDGRHLLDVAAYRDVTARLAERVPEMAVQVTTEAGGIYGPGEQMALVRELQPRFASVAIRELFAGDEEEAAGFLCDMQGDVAFQYIVYTPDDLERLADLVGRGIISQGRQHVQLVLGSYKASRDSEPRDFDEMRSQMRRLGLDKTAVWTVCAFGRGETACLEAAMVVGGHVRVGFENSVENADGSQARNNDERVMVIADLARKLSRTPAQGAKAAALLGAPTGLRSAQCRLPTGSPHHEGSASSSPAAASGESEPPKGLF